MFHFLRVKRFLSNTSSHSTSSRICIPHLTSPSISTPYLQPTSFSKRHHHETSSSDPDYFSQKSDQEGENEEEGMGKRRSNRLDTTSNIHARDYSLPTNSQITYQPYTYTPLPSSPISPNTPHTIRLLTLLPSIDPSSPLRCTLSNHTLSPSIPPYIALSYTWGERTAPPPLVLIDGHFIPITSNLRHALLRLRDPRDPVILWVDALCINQADTSERSIQTTRMRSVYVHAASVAVWLGKAHGSSHAAVEIVRSLNACAGVQEVRDLIAKPLAKEQLEALVMLFRRQYWWRIWVIQEVACAAHAAVYIGDEMIPWTELDGVCSVLREVEAELHLLFYKSPSWVRTLTHGGPRGLQLSRYNPTVAAPPLLELLLTHKSKKSTDPKDKVFALVGISSSRESFGDVDYSLSVSQIYMHTARHIIESTGRLDVICVKQHDFPQFGGLPSWVPDWTRPKAGAGATILGLHHRLPAFAAAGDKEARFVFEEDESGQLKLRVTGVKLGTITAAGRPYKKRGAPSFVGPSIEAFHNWWSLFLSSLPKPFGREESPSVADQVRFAHLVSCGTWVSQSEPEIVEKMSAIFSLQEERLSSSEYNIARLDASSRTSTDTMASSVSSLRDQDEDEELVELETKEQKERLSAMISAGMMMNRRRIFVTGDGIAGLAPWNSELGDQVVVLFGCKFPVVLRRSVEDNGKYDLIGEAYVEGFMHGQVEKGLHDGTYGIEEFWLS